MDLFGTAGEGPVFLPSQPTAHYVKSEAGITVALQGGPVRLKGVEAPSPAEALWQAYRARGPGVLQDLSGRFALAILDATCSSVLLALDRMGMESLAYAVRGNRIIFASSPAAVAAEADPSLRLRDQALFDYLLMHMVPAPDTVFEGVFKLRPGTCARFERGRLTLERYWVPRFSSGGQAAEFPALREELLTSLREGVAACRPDERTGSFLSGGLDSSTVTGMLGRVTGQPPRTFSIGFGVEKFNELEYARIANRHFGAHGHEYHVTADDIVDVFPKVAAIYDEPFGNSSAIPTYCCARLAAQQGVTHLLAGDGGDELFGGNERYVKQRVFELYAHVPAGIRKGLIEPLVRHLDPEGPIMPLRKLRSYVDQARIPMPERLESWNLMYRTDLGGMLEPEFRAAIDTRRPLATMAELYAQAPSSGLLQRMLFYDWHYTLSDNDLRKVGKTCELAGVRVSYPMLDQRVIDLSLQVPPEIMIEGHELRSFYKRALKGFLPNAILNKTKHGFGLPFGVWLKTHARLGDLIYGLLSALKSRRIVKQAFLDTLVHEAREGDAGYYGYAIWDLSMLEAWLQSHERVTRSSRAAA